MAQNLVNEYGTISIDNEIISKIASQSVVECYGVVGMGYKSKVDGLVEILKKDSISKGVKLEENEGKLYIELFVIIEYGTKISAVADNIIDKVKYNIEKLTSIKVARIDINVQGIRVSKQ